MCALGTDTGVAQRLRLRPGSLACMHLLEYHAFAIYSDPSGVLSLVQELAQLRDSKLGRNRWGFLAELSLPPSVPWRHSGCHSWSEEPEQV